MRTIKRAVKREVKFLKKGLHYSYPNFLDDGLADDLRLPKDDKTNKKGGSTNGKR